MDRGIYLWLVFSCFLIIAVRNGAGLILHVPLAPLLFARFKLVLFAAVIAGEIYFAEKKIQLFELILVVPVAVGLLFIIQHWAYGHLIFNSASFLLLGLFIGNALRSKNTPVALTLLYPVAFSIRMFGYHWPGSWWLELFSIFITTILLAFLLFRKKKTV